MKGSIDVGLTASYYNFINLDVIIDTMYNLSTTIDLGYRFQVSFFSLNPVLSLGILINLANWKAQYSMYSQSYNIYSFFLVNQMNNMSNVYFYMKPKLNLNFNNDKNFSLSVGSGYGIFLNDSNNIFQFTDISLSFMYTF